MILELFSEVFFEACLISFFITILYFILFVSLEEDIIMEHMTHATDDLVREFAIVLNNLTPTKKQDLIDKIENSEVKVNRALIDSINENNDYYYNFAIISVVVYSLLMLILSVGFWYKSGHSITSFSKHVVFPSVIATIIVIVVEFIFIVAVLGQFIPVDTNNTMYNFISNLQTEIETNITAPPISI